MQKTQQLNLPPLTPAHLQKHTLSTYTSLIRQGGIRLEQQLINDKHIYHNYGQGESEVSLAYGCGYIVSKMITLRKEDTRVRDVAVVGDGWNGVMTTLELVKRGHKVSLYTGRKMGKGGQGRNKVSVSEGLQFWYPSNYDNCDPLKHQLVSKLSFQFFQQCLSTNRYQSLKQAPLYCMGPKSEQLQQQITEFISKQIHPLTLTFKNLKSQPYTYFNTILINTDLFLQQLYTELQLRSTNIVQMEREFGSIEDLLKLKEEFVYDCMGVGVKKVFGDLAVREVGNFNVVVENRGGDLGWDVQGEFVVWVSSDSDNDEDYIIYFTKKIIQISSSNKFNKSYHENLEKWSQELIGRAYHYVKERTIKPFKL